MAIDVATRSNFSNMNVAIRKSFWCTNVRSWRCNQLGVQGQCFDRVDSIWVFGAKFELSREVCLEVGATISVANACFSKCSRWILPKDASLDAQ